MNKERQTALLKENFFIALDVIRAHKLRSSLIILGVAIGVTALMGMVSILLGLTEKIKQDVRSSEKTVVVLMKYDFFVQGGMNEAVLRRKDITEEDARAVKEESKTLEHVSLLVEPRNRPPSTLRYGNEKSRMISIIGSEPSLFHIWSLDLDEGRMFTEEELARRAKVVVLGRSPRRDLFPSVDPIGKQILIENDTYTVVGTFVERKTLFGNLAENFAVIPYTTYMGNMWRRMDDRRVAGALRDGVSLEAAKDDVIRIMRVRRKLKANQDNDFAVTSSDAAVEFLDRLTAPVAAVLAAISSIALLVGGIGVMNMMLVSVTERTGEIGIRKAVGATRMDILWQFLIEAGTLTGIGGVLGILGGWLSASGVSALTGLPSNLSPFYVVLAVIFSVGIGIFFGLYPANRASKLDPAIAMCYAK